MKQTEQVFLCIKLLNELYLDGSITFKCYNEKINELNNYINDNRVFAAKNK